MNMDEAMREMEQRPQTRLLDVIDRTNKVIRKLSYLACTVDEDFGGTDGMAFLLGDQGNELKEITAIVEGVIQTL